MLRVSSSPAAAALSQSRSSCAVKRVAPVSSSQSVASGAAEEAGGSSEPKRAKRHKQSHQGSTSGLAITQIRPTKFVRAVKFAVPRWQDLGDANSRRAFEVFLPSYLFPTNSRSLVRMKDREISTSRIIQYVMMIRLLCFLAFKVSSPSYTESADDDDDGGGRKKKKKMTMIPPKSTIIATWEIVPQKDDPKMVVGYRLRFTEKSENGAQLGMIDALKGLIEDNERSEWEKHMKGGQATVNRFMGATATINETSIKHLTHERWMRLCMEYAPELRDQVYGNPASGFGQPREHPLLRSLDNPDNPLHIDNIFTITRSLEMARNLGADPRYCNTARYIQNNGPFTQYGFASPESVWLVNHKDMVSYEIEHLYMPHIRPEPLEFAAQRDAFISHHAGPNATDDTRRRLAETFDLEVVQTTNNERPMDTYTLDAQVRHDLDQINNQHGQNRRRVALASIERAREVWIPMLTHIMDPDNNHAPPSINAIGVAKQEFLEINHHSFFQTRKRVTKNLTRFQDYTAMVMSTLNTIVTVRTNHRDCYLYLLCGLHVYAGSDLNPHILALGPPGVGKSFRLKFLKHMFIDGTVRVVSDLTLKALNVDGNGNDYVIYIFDDAKATMLGVGHNIKNSNTPSSDRVNTIKEMMTSREASVQTIIFDADGKRIGVFLKAKTTCVMMFNLNDPTCNFPDAVLDRAIIKVDSNHDINDDSVPDMIAKTTRSNNPLVKDALSYIRCHWQRKQILVSHILILISSGALPPVNLTMANIFFMLVKARARKRGVDMDGTRKHQRWCSVVNLLVIEDAVDLLWSSPTSPLAPKNGEPAVHHDDSHFLMVAKYLRATTQHIIFALGMLADQWKNDQRRTLLQAMLKLWFSESDLEQAIKEREKPVPVADTLLAPGNALGALGVDDPMVYDGMREKKMNWTHLYCESSAYKQLSGSVTSGKSSFAKVYTKEELGRHVSQQLMEHLHPKPLEGEAESLIRQLMDTTVEETRLVDHGETIDADNPREKIRDIRKEKKKVNALLVENNRIQIAVGALANHKVDGLFESVEEVAGMLHNSDEPCVYQYGETYAHMPNVWRQITAVKRPLDSSEMRIMNADHFDRMETEMTNAMIQSSGGERLPETLFEKNEYYVPDVDIDEMVALKHGITLGLSSQERLASPSNVESETESEWKAYWDSKCPTTMHYPSSFVRFTKGRQEKEMMAKAKKNPEMYKMSTQMERLKKQEQEWGERAAASAALAPFQPRRMQAAEPDSDEDQHFIDEIDREVDIENEIGNLSMDESEQLSQ